MKDWVDLGATQWFWKRKKRLHHIFFLQYAPKNNFLKKNILRKIWFEKKAPYFIKKGGPFNRTNENSNVFTR